MSGGGGGGQNTVTTQVEKLPAELVPFYQDLLGRGVYETLTGYETYPFRRLADFDPYEAGAQEAYATLNSSRDSQIASMCPCVSLNSWLRTFKNKNLQLHPPWPSWL